MLLSRFVLLHQNAIDSRLRILSCANRNIAEIDVSPQIAQLILAEKKLHFLPCELTYNTHDGMNIAIAFQLQSVDLSRNAIRSLHGIVQFKHLVRLDLRGNAISRIEDCEPLCCLTSLQQLDLANNRVTYLPHYRPHVLQICSINFCPRNTRIQLLDRKEVTFDEKRDAAAALAGEGKKLAELMPIVCCTHLLESAWKKLVLHSELTLPTSALSWDKLVLAAGRGIDDISQLEVYLKHVVRLRVSEAAVRNSSSFPDGLDLNEAILQPVLLRQAFEAVSCEFDSRLMELAARISTFLRLDCPPPAFFVCSWEKTRHHVIGGKELFLFEKSCRCRMRKCFSEWKAIFRISRAQRCAANVATSAYDTANLRRTFSKWKVLTHKAILMRRGTRNHELFSLRRCWVRWKAARGLSASSCRSILPLEETILRRAFCRWLKGFRTESRIRSCLCRKVFRVWKSAAAQHLASGCLRRKHIFLRCLSLWREKARVRQNRAVTVLRLRRTRRVADQLLLAKSYFTWRHFKHKKVTCDVSQQYDITISQHDNIVARAPTNDDARLSDQTTADTEKHPSTLRQLIERIIHLERLLVERDVLLEEASLQIESLQGRCDRQL